MDREEVLRQLALTRIRIKIIEQKAIRRLKESKEMLKKNQPKEQYMTDFKKSIKREMTREKFAEIRDHVYGDGRNTFDYTYGHVASWLAWNRNERGGMASVSPPSIEYTQRGRYYDGPIDTWDQDKASAGRRVSSRITTDIVFLGLNLSGDGRPPFPHTFQNARGKKG
jgi:hypothetical protein